MAITYPALKTEIQTDPATRGYAAPLAAGNHTTVANLLNAPIASVQIDREFVEPWEVADTFALTELKLLTAIQIQRLGLYLSMPRLRAKSPALRALLQDSFVVPVGTAGSTRAALVAMQTRNGSRMEALFGEGTQAGPDDVAKALRS